MNLGKIGIWTGQLDFVTAPALRDAVQAIEEFGFGAIWFGENIGREPIAQAGLVLSATQRLVAATGILNIWARDPLATLAGQLTLSEAYPDRFLLGLGASHALLVENERGHQYSHPVRKMSSYLEAMDRHLDRYRAVRPPATGRVLAALGPRMLALAAERADGAHPYFVPLEHTVQARAILGPTKLLAVEQAVVLEPDPTAARAIARRHTRRYLPLANYTNNLRLFGYDDDDFADNGSDRLVDAIVAWGDLQTVVTRIEQQWAAGADHVCIQVITDDYRTLPMAAWRELAEALANR
jgi:probable F420-dependent oxidoreductase